MGFTTPCFIRKSTKELTEKVYKLGGRDGRSFWHCDYLTLLLAEKQQFTCLDDEHGNAEMLIEKGFIDCGTNEELFLAIAALRDDTDDSQWFVYPPENIWFVCHDDDINYAREYIKESVQAAWFHCSHKASVNELIEHFKDKKEQLCVE